MKRSTACPSSRTRTAPRGTTIPLSWWCASVWATRSYALPNNHFVENSSHVKSSLRCPIPSRALRTNGACVWVRATAQVSVDIGGSDSLIMLGHVTFPIKTFLVPFPEYSRRSTICRRRPMLEELYVDHIAERTWLRASTPFERYSSSTHWTSCANSIRVSWKTSIPEAFDNIVAALGCDKDDIRDVYPLKQGLTNLSCHIRVGDPNMYRHPGIGTNILVSFAFLIAIIFALYFF